jgi:hypothetical protein
VWVTGEPDAEAIEEVPLAAVAGWSLSLAPRTVADAFPWRAYGLVVLPRVVLTFGLVTMTRMMRREVDLGPPSSRVHGGRDARVQEPDHELAVDHRAARRGTRGR